MLRSTSITAFVVLLGMGAAADDLPKVPDAPAILQPKEVTYETKVVPAKAKPGEVVTYTVTVKVAKPWHIYAYGKEQPKEGPRLTKFDVFGLTDLTPSGDWTPSEKPKSKRDAGFDNMLVEYYEGQVSWSRKFKIPADAKPGARTFRTQIYYQICDPKSCKPPTRVTVPDAELTVGGGAAFAPRLGPEIAALAVATVPKAASAAPSPSGEYGEATGGGLFAFLVYSALGGLFAVLMPCVWPMIPITVNFFVKQGEAKNGSPTKLAIVYCVAIITIFTGIGLGVTALLGATGATQLGGNKWVNLIFGIAFIGLGLSLLGLFEIRLPTALLNASASAEGKGGLVGVMFMAITLTITSFTCTAPVVGTLLVASTRGQYFYPVLGLLTFSAVMALPFFLLALMPGLLRKMPKSGDWMNAVKVVGGLVEIALAFKFLNTAEIGFGASSSSAWIDAQVVLTAWVVTGVACGIYLLGLFRTDHDHAAIQVGPIRMVSGIGFLGIALFLAPALFGNPPKSKFYDAIVGILPPDVGELNSREATIRETVAQLAELIHDQPTTGGPKREMASGEPEIRGPVQAVSSDPKVAVLQEKKFHGVPWGMSYEAALQEAKAKNKLVLIDFTGVYCTNCRVVEQTIMTKPDTIKEMKKFVTVSLFTDSVDIKALNVDDREALALENAKLEVKLVSEVTLPIYAVVSPEGTVLGTVKFTNTDDNFLRDFLKTMQDKHAAGNKVAAK
jgi:thiol:disulfide interchange protein